MVLLWVPSFRSTHSPLTFNLILQWARMVREGSWSLGHSDGSQGSDSDGRSIQAQQFASDGFPMGPEFQVNSYTTGNQIQPAIDTDSTGGFVITWGSDGSYGTDSDATSVQGQRFTSTGSPDGNQFQVNTLTSFRQGNTAVSFDSSEGFMVAWSSETAPEDTDIHAQRYVPEGNTGEVSDVPLSRPVMLLPRLVDGQRWLVGIADVLACIIHEESSREVKEVVR